LTPLVGEEAIPVMDILVSAGVVLVMTAAACCGFAEPQGPKPGPICEADLFREIEEEGQAAMQVRKRIRGQHRNAS
jgi:hypothetical protein